MSTKAQRWLERGVRVVWVIWPDHGASARCARLGFLRPWRELDVWTPGAAESRTLHDDDALDGGDVVPGFRIALGRLW